MGLRDYYNNWRIIMDEDEDVNRRGDLLRYSRELEEDLDRELVGEL